MRTDDARPSDAQLDPEIRRAPRSPARTNPVSPAQTNAVTDLEVGLEQREHRIAEDAMHVADQLLGSGGSAVPGRNVTVDGDLCLEVSGQRFNVTADGADLGRNPEPGGIRVADPRVSRQHARFVHVEEGLAVVDLGSTNGTSILRGDQRIAVASNPVVLAPGDRVATLNGVPLAEVVADFLG